MSEMKTLKKQLETTTRTTVTASHRHIAPPLFEQNVAASSLFAGSTGYRCWTRKWSCSHYEKG